MAHKNPGVIISCGAKKRDWLPIGSSTCAAAQMYVSPFFTLCLRYARTLAPDEDIFILSAKYGLLRLTDQIAPYELRIENRAWDYISFQAQVNRLGLRDRDVVSTCGGVYRKVLYDFFWDRLSCPLNGVGGIGKQMAWLKREIEQEVP